MELPFKLSTASPTHVVFDGKRTTVLLTIRNNGGGNVSVHYDANGGATGVADTITPPGLATVLRGDTGQITIALTSGAEARGTFSVSFL